MKRVVEAAVVEPHPTVLAAILAGVRAGACAQAARDGHGLAYEAVSAAQSRVARQHLQRVVGAGR